jgi:hypothetical protein
LSALLLRRPVALPKLQLRRNLQLQVHVDAQQRQPVPAMQQRTHGLLAFPPVVPNAGNKIAKQGRSGVKHAPAAAATATEQLLAHRRGRSCPWRCFHFGLLPNGSAAHCGRLIGSGMVETPPVSPDCDVRCVA